MCDLRDDDDVVVGKRLAPLYDKAGKPILGFSCRLESGQKASEALVAHAPRGGPSLGRSRFHIDEPFPFVKFPFDAPKCVCSVASS